MKIYDMIEGVWLKDETKTEKEERHEKPELFLRLAVCEYEQEKI